MSQQLHLFPEVLQSQDSESASDPLLRETRLLFQHEGSTDELVERILEAARAIAALSQKPATHR